MWFIVQREERVPMMQRMKIFGVLLVVLVVNCARIQRLNKTTPPTGTPGAGVSAQESGTLPPDSLHNVPEPAEAQPEEGGSTTIKVLTAVPKLVIAVPKAIVTAPFKLFGFGGGKDVPEPEQSAGDTVTYTGENLLSEKDSGEKVSEGGIPAADTLNTGSESDTLGTPAQTLEPGEVQNDLAANVVETPPREPEPEPEPPVIEAHYDFVLHEVKISLDTAAQSGVTTVFPPLSEEKDKLAFDDGNIRIVWNVSAANISFVLTNLTSDRVRLFWNDARYIDEHGIDHVIIRQRIVHPALNIDDNSFNIPPSTIESDETLSALIFPKDYVTFDRTLGWIEYPFLPYSEFDVRTLQKRTPEELALTARQYEGKTVGVRLPLQIGDTVSDYVFVFAITGSTVPLPEEK